MFVFRIEVFTIKLMISANYTLPLYKRLSDGLNDNLNPFLTLKDAIISPLDHPQQAQRVSQILVERSNMLLVTALREPEPPPDYDPPAQPTNREIVPTMFFTASLALQAKFFKRPDLSMSDMLEQRGEDFVPVKDVRIIPFNNQRSIVRDFACIGRAHIHALYAMADAVPTSPPGEQREA
jgi:hypothetical protein